MINPASLSEEARTQLAEFKKRFEVHSYPLTAKLLDALVTTYVDWGGKTKRLQMAIVD